MSTTQAEVRAGSESSPKGASAKPGARQQGPQAYDVPSAVSAIKGHTQNLARSDIASVLLHVWDVGSGEVKEHAHYATDANWIVLQGAVTFYRNGDEVLAKLGPQQGIFIPRGERYWFANTGTEKLVMLRTSAQIDDVPFKPETGFKDDRVFTS